MLYVCKEVHITHVFMRAMYSLISKSPNPILVHAIRVCVCVYTTHTCTRVVRCIDLLTS
jgi:hypothetical protein